MAFYILFKKKRDRLEIKTKVWACECVQSKENTDKRIWNAGNNQEHIVEFLDPYWDGFLESPVVLWNGLERIVQALRWTRQQRHTQSHLDSFREIYYCHTCGAVPKSQADMLSLRHWKENTLLRISPWEVPISSVGCGLVAQRCRL